jgi:hypothetical protein
MLIKLYWIVLFDFAFAISLVYLVPRIFRKRKVKHALLWGLFTAAFVAIAVETSIDKLIQGKVYIVNRDGETNVYRLLSRSPYHKTKDGKRLYVSDYQVVVINEMNQDLVLEKILYGSSFLGEIDENATNEIIPINSVYTSPVDNIDYFLEDTPPESVGGNTSYSSEVRVWLRTFDSYQKEFGDK